MLKLKKFLLTVLSLFFILLVLFVSYVTYFYVFDSDRVSEKVNGMIKSDRNIKLIAKNKETYNYVKDHKNSKLRETTDNQAPWPILYYVGAFDHKTLGVSGTLNNKGFHVLWPDFEIHSIYLE